VNVAITRAEQKLIFFGSKKTLSSSSCFSNLIHVLEDKQSIYVLPKNCHDEHGLPDVISCPETPIGKQSLKQIPRFGRPPLPILGKK
jgi:hypothetical protein